MSYRERQIRKTSNLDSTVVNYNNINLDEFPDSIFAYRNVKKLKLRRNRLKSIPDRIHNLHDLDSLYLNSNQLTEINGVLNLTKLTVLHLGYNLLKDLPDDIGMLVNLEELSINNNYLKTLPESIGNLTNLKILNLKGNSIEYLPDSFGNLQSLTCLYLHSNKITNLPESFGRLSRLKRLNLQNNKLKTLPESFKNLSNLNELDLKRNYFEELPDVFGNLVLVCLDLSHNNISSLPNSIGNLSSLIKLKLQNNLLTSFPVTLINLKSLIELDLNCNQIESIPESINELKTLKRLNLNHNSLVVLPEGICKLESLEKFSIENNLLESLPSSFGDLKNLLILNASKNNISVLPDSFGHLSKVKLIQMNDNRLVDLPNTIGNLNNLKVLMLDNNKLKDLPDSFGNLSNLKKLYLINNELMYFPGSFKRLHSIEVIFVYRNTTFIEKAPEDNLGAYELTDLFRGKIVMDPIYHSSFHIRVERVYSDLKMKSLYWNFDALKAMKVHKPKSNDLTDKDMIRIIQKIKETGLIDENEYSSLVEFVERLFNLKSLSEGKNHNLDNTIVLNLLSSVLTSLNEKLDDLESINNCVSDIAESINHGIHRQIAELTRAYLMNLPINSDKLWTFLYDFITIEKEKVFDAVILPFYLNGQIPIFNSWKYRLKDEIGFDCEFEIKPAGFYEDRAFGGEVGDIVQFFYSKFTPQLVISELTEQINKNSQLKNELIQRILSDENLNRREEMIVKNRKKFITEEAVEYILVKLGFVNRKLVPIESKLTKPSNSMTKFIIVFFIFCCILLIGLLFYQRWLF